MRSAGVGKSGVIRKEPTWVLEMRINILSPLLLLSIEVKGLTYNNLKTWPTKQQTLIFISRYSILSHYVDDSNRKTKLSQKHWLQIFK